MDENAVYSLWMMNSVKPSSKVLYKMLRVFDSPRQAYEAAAGAGLDPHYFTKREAAEFSDLSLDKAERMLGYCRRRGIRVVTFYDEEYPSMLRQIPTPPMALFVKGNLPDTAARPSVTVIGTRECSPRGRRIAARLAYDLSLCGVTVVSGMARGVDTCAHKGCLLAGKSPTVAVLAGSVEDVYPPENADLYRLIQASGAVVSENMPGSPTVKWGFHQRNRILSGMTYATVVVETGLSGGSMITVKHAVEQNKSVFAVPSDPENKYGEGTNELIKSGAQVCTCAMDIVDDLRYIFKDLPNAEQLASIRAARRQAAERRRARRPGQPDGMSSSERVIYDAVGAAGTAADGICDKTGMPFPQVVRALQSLELKGCIKQVRGGAFVRIK